MFEYCRYRKLRESGVNAYLYYDKRRLKQHKNILLELRRNDNRNAIKNSRVFPIENDENYLGQFQFSNYLLASEKDYTSNLRGARIATIKIEDNLMMKIVDNQFNTIMINVFYDLDNPNVKQGVAIDDTSKSYTFNVSSSDAKMSIDKYKSKSFNSILGVDTSGNVRKVKMDLPLNIDDDEKIDVRRVPNGNLNYVNYIKDVSEMSTVILTVTKSDMDNEIITPNKEYLVNNYSSYSEYNGNYILSFKKETFVQQSNDFVCATVFGLRKANG